VASHERATSATGIKSFSHPFVVRAAYFGQEPVLFDGSVFDNIANGLVGTPWETASHQDQMDRIQKAAKLAFAHDFILQLPNGYNTSVGQRGGVLSGGQKQRIAIARSVVSEPKILLLDEATSALDPHAEGIVQQALDSVSRNRTTIVIAHKLATIRNADNIVVMSSGKILEQGTHDSLVAQHGAYALLVEAQSLSTPQADDEKSETPDSGSIKEEAEPMNALSRHATAETFQLKPPRDPEDYELVKKTNIIHTVVKLMQWTPELKYWYLATFATCVLGGKYYLLSNFLQATRLRMECHVDTFQLSFFPAKLFFLAIFWTSSPTLTLLSEVTSSHSCFSSCLWVFWLYTLSWGGRQTPSHR
jgi:ATP-binding cassette subfamily B (MDR/TAP) protein 1